MGWADLLILKGIRYDSEEALKLARDIMKFITKSARDESRIIGKEKGNFPNKDLSIWKEEKYMRNATVTTIAPTGSISIIADCSSGIEPIFAFFYKRNVEASLGKTLTEVNSIIKKLINDEDVNTYTNIDDIPMPNDIRSVLVTSGQIDPIWHIRTQASFQKYTDNAVSKTVNLPNEATINDIEKIFLESYRLGCKGITVYRDGSRSEQLLTKIEETDKECKGKSCSL